MFYDDTTIAKLAEENLILLFQDLKTADSGTKEHDAILRQIQEIYRLREMSETFKLKVTESNNKADETNARIREAESNAKFKDAETESKRRLLDKPWKHVSPETLIVAGVNLVGILLVLNHERLGVVTSKAFGMIRNVK